MTRTRTPAGLLVAVLGAALVLSLAHAAPARAAGDDFLFTGRGYGSGVGMSQWGAWQAAREGKDFRFILGFYYPGTDLTPLDDPNLELNVKISSEPWKSVSSLTQNYKKVDLGASVTSMVLVEHGPGGDTSEVVAAGAFLNVWLEDDGGVYVFTTGGGRQGPFSWVEARPADDTGRVKIQLKTTDTADPLAPREYWGKMRVQPSETSGYLNVFNLVPMERYLRSIGEVASDWAQPGSQAYAFEAVKAQAVAARTYAVANRDPYLNDNQWDQVYLGYFSRGYSFEDRFPGIPQAAEQTAGLVLRYQGRIISAHYSSHSGGYTTALEPDRYPYFPAKPDPFSLEAPPPSLSSVGPGYPWTCTVDRTDLSNDVNGMEDVDGKQVSVGTLKKVEVLTRDTPDPTSHALTLRLTGSAGAAVIAADDLRRALGYGTLRSTLILDIQNPPETEPLPPGEFSDVGREGLYYQEIKRAALANLVNGYPDGTFKPQASVSRWQFAKIAVLLHNQFLPDDRITVQDVDGTPFWDVAVRPGTLGDESDWIMAAFHAGIVQGVTATNFRPYEPVGRDEMASILVRALGWADEAGALPDDVAGFSDVPASSPHFAATRYLKYKGILQGYEDPLGSGAVVLRPGEPIKRMHVAVILCRLLDLPH
jgi:peptidoglycan hydrolase-like amidase